MPRRSGLHVPPDPRPRGAVPGAPAPTGHKPARKPVVVGMASCAYPVEPATVARHRAGCPAPGRRGRCRRAPDAAATVAAPRHRSTMPQLPPARRLRSKQRRYRARRTAGRIPPAARTGRDGAPQALAEAFLAAPATEVRFAPVLPVYVDADLRALGGRSGPISPAPGRRAPRRCGAPARAPDPTPGRRHAAPSRRSTKRPAEVSTPSCHDAAAPSRSIRRGAAPLSRPEPGQCPAPASDLRDSAP